MQQRGAWNTSDGSRQRILCRIAVRPTVTKGMFLFLNIGSAERGTGPGMTKSWS